MRQTILVAATLLALALTITACGSDGSDGEASARPVDASLVPSIETAFGPAIRRQLAATLADPRLEVTSFRCVPTGVMLRCVTRAVSRGKRGTATLAVRVNQETQEVSGQFTEVSVPAWARAIEASGATGG